MVNEVDMPIGRLNGNFTVIDDVEGLALVGYKRLYDGDINDNVRYHQYINTTYYSKLGLVDLGKGPESLQKIVFKGRVAKVDSRPTTKMYRLAKFLQPCYSEEDQRIYQSAHQYDPNGYDNAGRRVLLSITKDGVYEVFTADILGTGYIDQYDPFYVSPHKGCKVEIAQKYLETLRKSCAELNLPFTCLDKPENGAGMILIEEQEVDFSKPQVVQLVASAEQRDQWPVKVKITKPDGEQQKLSLPVGSFVEDSGFFKELSCFSCGCSCYQHLELSLVNGDYYLMASGRAIDDRHRGIHKLSDDKSG